MSSSCRRVCCAFAILLPVLLLMLPQEAASLPFGFGLLDSLSDTNGQSLIGALALAHIDRAIDKLQALADLASTFVEAAADAAGGQ